MVIIFLVALLCSNAVSLNRDKSILFSRFVIKNLLISSYIAMNNLFIKCLSTGIAIYGGLFNVTTFTQTFNIFVFLISGVILTLSAFYPRKLSTKLTFALCRADPSELLYNKMKMLNKSGEEFRILEYSLIITFILCGSVFLMTSADLISIFLSVELQSYGLYILSTIYREKESSTASGLTYFLLGGLSSCFILLGSALLYVNSGTTNLDNIYIIGSISELKDFCTMTFWYIPYYWHISLIIMSVGFLFKISAAPFHFWSPDVYDGVPTIVTTYIAIIAKISIFVILLELVYYTEYYIFDFSWKNVLLISSLFSLIIGSVLGLTQFRIKRLLAYSTVSHVGFILLALSVNSPESVQSYIFYILQYTISNLNVFIILISIGSTFLFYERNLECSKHDFKDINNSPLQLISQIKGYFYINPIIAISLGITLFSFIGIPPMIGFFAKQMVLSAALDSGHIFMVVIAVITSVIGAAYYLNIVKQIFFFKPDFFYITPKEDDFYPSSVHHFVYSSSESVLIKEKDIILSSSLASCISVMTLIIISFIWTPDILINLIGVLSIIIFKV